MQANPRTWRSLARHILHRLRNAASARIRALFQARLSRRIRHRLLEVNLAHAFHAARVLLLDLRLLILVNRHGHVELVSAVDRRVTLLCFYDMLLRVTRSVSPACMPPVAIVVQRAP